MRCSARLKAVRAAASRSVADVSMAAPSDSARFTIEHVFDLWMQHSATH
ncbi:hypothetical protein HMPREF1318_0621 [Actinomyces massiliensis F0489]|uniref:Uncharacterized protein n=1 Tax=Actinomyces massiliensis F0489 TaxID=1125718 RepID=J0NPI4_9ACTO|nr:hypothetical protein HMPREF1318_0621 [Actinomyces massiliensis F0489]